MEPIPNVPLCPICSAPLSSVYIKAEVWRYLLEDNAETWGKMDPIVLGSAIAESFSAETKTTDLVPMVEELM